ACAATSPRAWSGLPRRAISSRTRWLGYRAACGPGGDRRIGEALVELHDDFLVDAGAPRLAVAVAPRPGDEAAGAVAAVGRAEAREQDREGTAEEVGYRRRGGRGERQREQRNDEQEHLHRRGSLTSCAGAVRPSRRVGAGALGAARHPARCALTPP